MYGCYHSFLPALSILVLISLAAGQQAPMAPAKRPVTIEDVLARQQVHRRSPLSASPDGTLLAITLQGAHDDVASEGIYTLDGISAENLGTRVSVLDLSTGERLEPFPQGATSYTPQFSPDGRWLAAYVRHQGHVCLAVWSREDRETRFFRDAPVRVATGWMVPRWTPDSSRVVVLTIDSDDQDAAATEKFSVFSARHDPGRVLGPLKTRSAARAASLVAVNVETGEQVVIEGSISTGCWRVSPDGRLVAYPRFVGRDEKNWMSIYEMVVAPIDGSAPPRSLGGTFAGHWEPSFSWSPDAGNIGIVSGRAIYVARLDGPGAQLSLPEGASPVDGNPPAWSADSTSLLIPDGDNLWRLPIDGATPRKIALGYEDVQYLQRGKYLDPMRSDTENRIWLRHTGGAIRIDVDSGQVLQDLTAKRIGGRERLMSSDGSSVFTRYDHRYVRLDLGGGDEGTVLSIEPETEGLALAKVEQISFALPSGVETFGTVLLPADHRPGERLPTVMVVYAGARAPRIDHAIVDAQVLTGLGYAVYSCAMPLEGRDPVEEIAAMVDAAADAVVIAGYADPDRIALMGQSYGVYTALSALTRTDRYRTAVVSNGLTSMVAAYTLGMIGYAESGQGSMGGPLWEKPDHYAANSPFHDLDRVTTPVLVIAGESDDTNKGMMLGLYLGLRSLDRTVEYHRFGGGTHGPEAWPATQRRRLARIVCDWLDTTLRLERSPPPPDAAAD